ncbi:hypothetical protein CW304_11785 [Bacillus sp. UFRGS-B20]|nr:hypothetical protein CW304_11785 [Bacillus sp. UFRGS-B20]
MDTIKMTITQLKLYRRKSFVRMLLLLRNPKIEICKKGSLQHLALFLHLLVHYSALQKHIAKGTITRYTARNQNHVIFKKNQMKKDSDKEALHRLNIV